MEKNKLTPKAQKEIAKAEEQQKLQDQLELSIKEYISKNSGGRYLSVKALLFEMIAGRSMDWEDKLSVIKKQIQGIIAVFMEPAVIGHFKKICPDDDEHVGETLVRLLEFFCLLENPLSYAEIDLGSFEEVLQDLDYIKGFKLPYEPSFNN